MENKEETLRPLKDEELEAASGGILYSESIVYRCTVCGYQFASDFEATACPRCNAPVEEIGVC